ncbi:MAG: Fic family protein, partial [Steroidobacteraceae bacterium]
LGAKMHVTAAEPFLPDVLSDRLESLAVELPLAAGQFSGRLAPRVRLAIGDLVRSMNCYYSNLIEGHDAHPHDIDRALAADYSSKPEKRALQLEARAHIEVQRMIDGGQTPGVSPLTLEYVLWTHREFCSRLPKELLSVEDPKTTEKLPVVPGQLRTRMVVVGVHVPPPPEDLPAFMDRFEAAYRVDSKLKQLVGVAASHHRLAWIHPFLDGNGRVVRLVSHALLKELGVGSTLWSVSRGLARSIADYKANLMAADEPRRGDLDGRGNLSRGALISFCEYFLSTCLDQVRFMGRLLAPTSLTDRIQRQVLEEERKGILGNGAHRLMRAVSEHGELSRGDVPSIVQASERTGQRITKSLIENGYLQSEGPADALKFAIPSAARDFWFPSLYPNLPAATEQ